MAALMNKDPEQIVTRLYYSAINHLIGTAD